MPVPIGPQPASTITSPARIAPRRALIAAIAARSLVKTRAGPVLR